MCYRSHGAGTKVRQGVGDPLRVFLMLTIVHMVSVDRIKALIDGTPILGRCRLGNPQEPRRHSS